MRCHDHLGQFFFEAFEFLGVWRNFGVESEEFFLTAILSLLVGALAECFFVARFGYPW